MLCKWFIFFILGQKLGGIDMNCLCADIYCCASLQIACVFYWKLGSISLLIFFLKSPKSMISYVMIYRHLTKNKQSKLFSSLGGAFKSHPHIHWKYKHAVVELIPMDPIRCNRSIVYVMYSSSLSLLHSLSLLFVNVWFFFYWSLTCAIKLICCWYVKQLMLQ